MIITREFTIDTVTIFRNFSHPFTLSSKNFKIEFDDVVAQSFGLNDLENASGKILVCTMESRSLQTAAEGQLIDGRAMTNNDLMIESLSCTEEFQFHHNPVTKYHTVKRILHLTEESRGGSYTIVSWPLYSFTIELSEEEYVSCAALEPASAFRLTGLQIKDAPVVEEDSFGLNVFQMM